MWIVMHGWHLGKNCLMGASGVIFHGRNVWRNIQGKFSGENVQGKCLGVHKMGISGEVNVSWGKCMGEYLRVIVYGVYPDPHAGLQLSTSRGYDLSHPS